MDLTSTRLGLVMMLLCFWSPAVVGQSPTDMRGDTQSWNKVQFTVPLGDRIDLTFRGDLRLGRNLGDFVDERVGASLRFKLSTYIELSSGYEYVVRQPERGRTTYENRISFAGTVKVPVGRFSIENRNQFERRVRNSASDTTRYRNRLLLSRQVKFGDTQIKLFVSDEVFYDFAEQAWTKNRFSVGGEKKFSDQFALEIYYTRQNDGFSRPGDLNVIGTTFKLRK